MPSKPRHGRDYRKRTPRNTDLLQNPSAGFAAVVVIQVNQTDTRELTWDFIGEISDLGEGTNLGVVSITAGPTIDEIWGDGTAVHPATSIAQQIDGIAPGQSRVICQYDLDIETALMAACVRDNGLGRTTFLNRPIMNALYGPIGLP